MNKNTRNGLFALGLAAAAAWWKATPEQKANVKSKLSGIGDKLKGNLNNIKDQVSKQGNTQSAS